MQSLGTVKDLLVQVLNAKWEEVNYDDQTAAVTRSCHNSENWEQAVTKD